MDTVVAHIRLTEQGPALLLSEHLTGQAPILIYRVADFRQAVTDLKARGIHGGRELEIPHGPCYSFEAPGGQRIAIYELVRPEVNEAWTGRIDR